MSSPDYKEISADLVDFVSKLTQSVADAQTELDRNAVNTLEQLAKTTAKIPKTTNTIEEVKNSDGQIVATKTHTNTTYAELSLLNLGVMPTFYQFANTKIEVALDMQFEEEVKTNSDEKQKRFLVSTKKVRTERRYNTNIQAYSKLSLEMVPVPMPSNIPELIENLHKS